jgi:hypothetical protein
MLHGKNNYIRLSLFSVVGISIVVSSIFLKDFKGDVPLIVSPASTALSTIDESILERIELTKSEVLNKHSEKYALGFFLFGSLYLLIIPIINNLKLFFIYALFNLSKKAKYELDSEVWWILGLVSIPLLIQVLYAGFLQARYAVFISVIILAALVLTYRESLLPKKQLSKSLAIVFLFILFVDGLISMGASREYRVDTVEWVHENVLDTDFVISNERTVSYSMQHLKKLEHGIIDDPGCNIIQNYDYYVHGSGKRKKDLPNCVKNQEMVTAFQNKKGHSLQVYKMTKTEQ